MLRTGEISAKRGGTDVGNMRAIFMYVGNVAALRISGIRGVTDGCGGILYRSDRYAQEKRPYGYPEKRRYGCQEYSDVTDGCYN